MKFFRKIHLWLSVPFGIFIALVCFSGAMLIFEQEITRSVRHDVYYVASSEGEPLPMSELLATAQSEIPDSVSITGVTVFKDKERAYQVNLSKPSRASLFIDQYSGKVTGRYERLGFFSTMFKLHRWLLDSANPRGEGVKIGKTLVGISTLIFVIALITGIVLWWPRARANFRRSMSIPFSKGMPGFWKGLHVAGGMYALIFVLAMALTGLTWSFNWYRTAFYAVCGVEHTPREMGGGKPGAGTQTGERGGKGGHHGKKGEQADTAASADDASADASAGHRGKHNGEGARFHKKDGSGDSAHRGNSERGNRPRKAEAEASDANTKSNNNEAIAANAETAENASAPEGSSMAAADENADASARHGRRGRRGDNGEGHSYRGRHDSEEGASAGEGRRGRHGDRSEQAESSASAEGNDLQTTPAETPAAEKEATPRQNRPERQKKSEKPVDIRQSPEPEKTAAVEMAESQPETSAAPEEEISEYAQWQSVYNSLRTAYPEAPQIAIKPGTASVTLSNFGNGRAADTYDFDPATGKTTPASMYADANEASRLRGWIYAIHTGGLGGLTTRIIWFLTALLGASLPLTGYYIWIKRLIAKNRKK